MLLHRTLELASVLPSKLRGTIQFEVATDAGPLAQFHLRLAGTRTTFGDGVSEAIDARVSTSDRNLHALMFAASAPKDALLVSGNADLFLSLLQFLKNSAAPKSLLGVRCQS